MIYPALKYMQQGFVLQHVALISMMNCLICYGSTQSVTVYYHLFMCNVWISRSIYVHHLHNQSVRVTCGFRKYNYACLASDYRLGLQWMPVDLLIQQVHRALKVIYSYRYYNYTNEHSILLKLPIAFGHHYTYTTWGLSLYANFFQCYLLRNFFIHQPHPESIVVSYQLVSVI